MTRAKPFCPYKGLQPYTEKDRDYFFGREEDQETIAANLVTAPLTILYGVSGVGKTSVLQAGVVPFLQGLPNVMVVVFREWQDRTFLSSLKGEIARAVTERTGQSFSADDAPLDEFLLQAAGATRGTIALILDQFEEYFLYHPEGESGNHFDAEFARTVNRDEIDANFLLSIREDSLACLDRFQGRIPNLFDNYLRIERLDYKAASKAIEEPVKKYNELRALPGQEVSVEPELVEAVLKQIKTGEVVLGEARRGVGKFSPAPTEMRIEASYLQLVMTRLWDEEMRAGSDTLRLEKLNDLGGAKQIVKRHLDVAMSALTLKEQDAAARVFHYLVTPDRTKIAHTVPALEENTKLPQTQLTPVLDKLSHPAIRILRPVAPPPDQPTARRYEIFHDVLAPAILDWRARKERARERRVMLLRLGVVGLVGVLILTMLATFYWRAREARVAAEERIELVNSWLQSLDPTYEVPSYIALTLTSSDMVSIVSKFQTRQIESIGEEEEEEEEEEEAPISTSVSPLGELVEATYRLRLLKNSTGFVPKSLEPDRFQRISSHEHYRVGGDIGAYFEAMGILGIQKAVFFPTGLGSDNRGYRENMEKLLRLQELYPKQIIAFCTVDEGDAEAPAIFRDCLEKDGRGLKLIGGHPDFYEPENPLDSPTMMQVYGIADRHHVPVVIHINMIKFPELQSQFEHILRDFPDIPFVAAHYCKDAPPFELCAHLLDTYSNLYTDLSMGGALDRYLADISIHRDDYRNFILQYQDRILWGADLIIDDPQAKTADFIRRRISYDFYLLETGSKYDPAMEDTFRDIPKGAFAPEDVQLFGLDLPEETLRKIYWDNPRQVLGLSD